MCLSSLPAWAGRRTIQRPVGRIQSGLRASSLSCSYSSSFRTHSLPHIRPFTSIGHRFVPLNVSFPSAQSSPLRSFTTASLAPLPRVRNVAIIAHVDHGKTTLVDCLLRHSATALQGDIGQRFMDSNALEKERGITILSKCTSIAWRLPQTDGEVSKKLSSEERSLLWQLNIVDTPGHADFGGEVERIMTMVDGVCLVVDATDGPMTQTKFVLQKALKRGLRPVVVINKVDRDTARVGEVENEVFDLFANLNATDDQMDFPIVYACARDGWATYDAKQKTTSMTPLFETIISHIRAPKVDTTAPFSMLITQIDSDQHLGKLLIGRIHSGKVKTNDKLKVLDPAGKVIEEMKVMKIMCRRGTDRVVVDEGVAGDIISLAGFSKATVNSTLCVDSVKDPIPSIPIDPPTISMNFFVNDSPLAGQESREDGFTASMTSAMIRDRLVKEAESNVSIQIIENNDKDSFQVRARGELQLGILIETMRREGYELSVSAPKVVYKKEQGKGSLLEPIEDVIIDSPPDFTGSIIEKLSNRKGEIIEFTNCDDGRARLHFRIPLRGLIGFRAELIHQTHGQATLNSTFHGYAPHCGELMKNDKGAIISQSDGVVTAYALEGIEPRGILFVSPGMKTYCGMVIGECSREFDIDVNPTKSKATNNIRQINKDEKIRLSPPRLLSLEEMIACVRDDEVIEVTRKSIRLRKKILNTSIRISTKKSAKKMEDEVVQS